MVIPTLSARQWLLAVGILAALLFGLTAWLTTCDTKQPQELSRRAERRVRASRDSALASAAHLRERSARTEAQAQAAYLEARRYEDSATYYRTHEATISVPASDTARLQRLWAEIFR